MQWVISLFVRCVTAYFSLCILIALPVFMTQELYNSWEIYGDIYNMVVHSNWEML